MHATLTAVEAKTRRAKRGLLRRITEFAVFLALLYLVICFAAAYALTRGSHIPVTTSPTSIGAKYENVSFLSHEDGITLKGWLFAAASASSGRSVVMAHGWQQNRVNGNYTAGVAHDLIAHGYSVLLFDERGCGESGGDSYTLGDKERYDVLGAYDFMKQRGYTPAQMTMMGLSMGAAATIEATPQLTDIAAIVPDSSFAELRPVLEAQLPNHDYLPSFFNWGILGAAGIFGDNPDLRPVDVVRSLPHRAFLFFHGGSDTLVPLEQARELRTASANPESDLVIVAGAAHTFAYHNQPVAYMDRLYKFIDQQITEKSKQR